MMDAYSLTNARGETVQLNNFDSGVLAYGPTGLGVNFTNTYSQYQTHFKLTKSMVSQGQYAATIVFGQVESLTYSTFNQFASFLAYQPLTLTYSTDAGTWKRDARLLSLGKSEKGGGVVASDRINESFTLDFINPWYNNKTADYKSYDADPNLGAYGKIYRPKYDLSVGGRNLLLNSKYSLVGVGSSPYFNQSVTPDFYSGKKMTASVDVKYTNITALVGTGFHRLVFAVQFVDGAGNVKYFDTQRTVETVGDSFTGRVSSTIDLTGFTVASVPTATLYIQGISATSMLLANPKLEIGNMPTDWTPAPEDNEFIPNGYVYQPYYVYQESNRPSTEKAMSLNNNSQYFGIQKGSPSLITITGPTSVNPSWTLIQNGNVVGTDGFALTLSSNQKLVVSSYPEDQYARVYNPDGSYVDVSQLQDYTKTNFVQIPEGESTALFYLDTTSQVNITFKEERLLV